MEQAQTTTVTLHTPPGRGAVAVIVVDGALAAGCIDRYFRTRAAGGELPINRIVYGCWQDADVDDGVAEDVVVCRRGPHQFEVQCHGGTAAVDRIIGNCKAFGAVPQAWPASQFAAQQSPIRAAAAVALSKATTLRAAAVLLDQFHGALEHAVETAMAAIQDSQFSQALATLDELLERSNVGLHLTDPWQIVIAGPPNVGKSSLINRLLGYERAIVFDKPGTTRDAVSESTAFDGWPVRLTDTAGLRTTTDFIEQAGIDRAKNLASTADCLVLLFDATEPWTSECDQLVSEWPSALVVHNKVDLSPAKAAGLAVSAAAGTGLDEMMQAIVKKLVPMAPPHLAVAPFTAEQVARLRRAKDLLLQDDCQSARAELNAMLIGARGR